LLLFTGDGVMGVLRTKSTEFLAFLRAPRVELRGFPRESHQGPPYGDQGVAPRRPGGRGPLRAARQPTDFRTRSGPPRMSAAHRVSGASGAFDGAARSEHFGVGRPAPAMTRAWMTRTGTKALARGNCMTVDTPVPGRRNPRIPSSTDAVKTDICPLTTEASSVPKLPYPTPARGGAAKSSVARAVCA